MKNGFRVLGMAGLLWAGTLGASASAQDVSLGYQFQRLSAGGQDINAALGFNADASFPITPTLDAFGQFDWSRKSESQTILGIRAEASVNFSAFGGGVRWSGRTNPNLTPFVQALFGAMHASGSASIAGQELVDDSGTRPLVQFGGGLTAPVRGRLRALAQFDYRRVFTERRGLNSIRFVGGIRITN